MQRTKGANVATKKGAKGAAKTGIMHDNNSQQVIFDFR
jgi:hypothetical protein